MIKNEEEILSNALSGEDSRARQIALKLIKEAIKSVDPYNCVKTHVKRDGDKLLIDGLRIDLSEYESIFVIGGGKASGAMAQALEEILGDRITNGLINILKGTKSKFKTSRIKLHEASHPIPGEDGVEGAEEIIRIAEEAGEKDLVFCLISGGGSALMPLPAEGISLSDKKTMTDLLLKSGATINEFNVVRKHISRLKGGQLAKAAYPATLVSLILSDVVGDPLDTIASGPTSPDKSTFKDALGVLEKYGLWPDKVPDSVRRRIEAGVRGEVEETPKPGDEVFRKTFNVIIGSNRLAAEAALKTARQLGLNSLILSTMIEGEAREVGIVYAGIVREIASSGNPVKRPAAIIAGGETTVTVTGKGLGGRNQEVALSAASKIAGLRGVAIASVGTDGIDGPTDAAGAIVDGSTIERSMGLGLDWKTYLKNNDSYSFFKKLGDLIFTGPTGTNVNDLAVLVVV